MLPKNNRTHYFSATSNQRNKDKLQVVLLRDIEVLEEIINEQSAKLSILESYISVLILGGLVGEERARAVSKEVGVKDILRDYQQYKDSFSLEKYVNSLIEEKINY